MNKATNVAPLENPNTRIWDKICETDPNRTKDFNKGYRGTSINPNYIYEKLTGCFGPCGIGWGFIIVKDEYKEGHEGEISHSITVDLWYKNGDVKSEPIPGIGGTPYVFKDKNGWHTDEDAPKKSLTDALTKATQLIGMSADIFGGLWNDCKYVAELKKKYNSDDSQDDSETPPLETSNQQTQETQTSKPDTGGKKVTKSQAGLIFHKFKEAGFSTDDMKEYLLFYYKVKTNYELPMTAVKVILGLFDKGELVTVGKKKVLDDVPF